MTPSIALGPLRIRSFYVFGYPTPERRRLIGSLPPPNAIRGLEETRLQHAKPATVEAVEKRPIELERGIFGTRSTHRSRTETTTRGRSRRA